VFDMIKSEHEKTTKYLLQITNQTNLLAKNPNLAKSLQFRLGKEEKKERRGKKSHVHPGTESRI
jgi:hypothetical protein